MTWAPTVKPAGAERKRFGRGKVKRFTRKQLHRAREAELRHAALLSKAARLEVKRRDRAAAKVDAALEGCEDQ